jgi:hypothetical protein
MEDRGQSKRFSRSSLDDIFKIEDSAPSLAKFLSL